MPRNRSGFTLIELLVVITLISISITLATPSWRKVGSKRGITNVTEQVASFLSVAQSEAQKRNQPVSLSFNRAANQTWCIGTTLGDTACDCTESDVRSTSYCAIDGIPSHIQASDFSQLNLVEASDTQPGSGDSGITFDPIRGILQPAGDKLQFTFQSIDGYFQLRLQINPAGLLSICSPDDSTKVGGYTRCTT